MWYGFSEWRGANGKVTRKEFKLQVAGADGQAFLDAVDANDNLTGALNQITNATLQDKGVRYVVEDYNVGLGDLTEQALVNVWAEDPDNAIDVLAISQVYIPAPVIGVFQSPTGSGMDIVDTNDPNLQAFITALSDYAYISDHEVIDVGAGNGGLENGRRVTRRS